MLFTSRFLAGVEDGTVTHAYRRWQKPRVRAGSQIRTAAGVIGVTAITEIEPNGISEADARHSGYSSRADLLASLEKYGNGPIYRIRVCYLGPDPREQLRSHTTLTADDFEAVSQRLMRMDAAGRNGPWTSSLLRLIRERPGVRAAELARAVGEETAPFKRNVRKLKELGLTESLEVGYRLSPRGQSVLRRMFREP